MKNFKCGEDEKWLTMPENVKNEINRFLGVKGFNKLIKWRWLYKVNLLIKWAEKVKLALRGSIQKVKGWKDTFSLKCHFIFNKWEKWRKGSRRVSRAKEKI